jgi:hypothetical protein
MAKSILFSKNRILSRLSAGDRARPALSDVGKALLQSGIGRFRSQRPTLLGVL